MNQDIEADSRKGIAKIFPVLRHFNVPNTITTMGMVFGIFCCYFLTQGDLRMAIICLFMAGVMDLVDGYVAGKLNQQTAFGRHVDTLVDFFTCVIIPIWMVYDLLGAAPVIVVPMIFYCICGLWRLANYNITEAGKSFSGVPVPTGMLMVTVTIWFVYMFGFPALLASAVFVVMGFLMISGFRLPKYGMWQIGLGLGGLGFMVHVILTV